MSFFLILIGWKPVKNIFDLNGYFTYFLVSITSWIFKALGIFVSSQGTIIHLKGFSMNVLFGCNGLEAFLIYTVGIISFPSKFKVKIYGIIFGFIILQIINVLRIIGLGLAGIYMKKSFDFIHIYLAQSIMIVVAVIMFIIWLNYAVKKQDS
jgi:exosortase/archaeosortase family protein